MEILKEKRNALEELRSMRWKKSFDDIVGKKGAWQETVEESNKILKPVLERNKKWREESRRGMVNFG